MIKRSVLGLQAAGIAWSPVCDDPANGGQRFAGPPKNLIPGNGARLWSLRSPARIRPGAKAVHRSGAVAP